MSMGSNRMTGSTDSGQEILDAMLDVLDLERLELDLFRGLSVQGSPPRVFGGQVAAQSLIAAARTVPDGRPPHSLHSYFIRGGDPAIPVVFIVDRIRDGRSFSVRRVIGQQNGKAIFALTASFQVPARGLEHGTPAPIVPAPQDCPQMIFRAPGTDEEQDPGEPHFLAAFEMRVAQSSRRSSSASGTAGSIRTPTDGPPDHEPEDATWIRAAGVLPDDPLTHTAVVVFASDFGIVDGVLSHHRRRHGQRGMRQASLDHVMWFHHQVQADEWMLYRRVSPAASGGRGLGIGEIFDQSGVHRVTVAQEAMFRLPEFLDD
jgi:acyl-CoA thioesterase-2